MWNRNKNVLKIFSVVIKQIRIHTKADRRKCTNNQQVLCTLTGGHYLGHIFNFKKEQLKNENQYERRKYFEMSKKLHPITLTVR